MQQSEFPFILYGGDYNPEQWPEELWDEDVALMLRTGVNTVTLPVFGWGNIQTGEDLWEWGWLDRIFDKLEAAGISICLATGTAATPPWVDAKYAEILRVDPDGRRRSHGTRHTFCPNSPQFRRLSVNLAEQMAKRYGHRESVLLWHISNEYGNHCYCDLCSAAFRKWLEQRYGSLERVNHAWNTYFWGQTYTDWSQIEAPVEKGQRNFMGMLVDYDRFQSASILACCKAEAEVLRKITPDLPITTNMMGAFKPLDYHDWAKELDVVSWDSYPSRDAKPSETAFKHSLMRGLKEGKPWILIEQTPSQTNWQAYNSLKRPGELRLLSLQAIAHGADGAMYFQWRKSPGGQEMLHGAVMDHSGSTETRVFREVEALGKELKALGTTTVGSRLETPVAILFDWDNWWAVEHSSGPNARLQYPPNCVAFFEAFGRLGITADVVSPEAELSGYKVVVAPVLKMLKPGWGEKFTKYTEEGGTFMTTFFSGIVNETDRAILGGYPGPLKELLGIWVEETDSLGPNEQNRISILGKDAHEYSSELLCDRIHLRGAEVVGTYGCDFYSGEPAITKHRFGAGEGWYLGTQLGQDGLTALLSLVCQSAGVRAPLLSAPVEGVEVTERKRGEKSFAFVLNHSRAAVRLDLTGGPYSDLLTGSPVSGTLDLPPYGVVILAQS